MTVCLVMPSARPPEEALPVLKQWKERGYEVLLQRDLNAPSLPGFTCVLREYRGYPEAVNTLIAGLLRTPKPPDWIVCAGDDTLPDPNKSAEEIARECSAYFLQMADPRRTDRAVRATFGVMQPTGDRWEGSGPGTGASIDRIAGSPWMGREWCRRINGGRGPLWPEYFHCGADEELQLVAQKYGVFWQRPDLTHLHNHWGRPRTGEIYAPEARCPDFAKRANSKEEWQHYKRVFDKRKAEGFPGSEPIA